MSLTELRAVRIDADDPTISYRISCPCGSEVCTIASERDGSNNLWLDPYVFTCVDCGRQAIFFDSSRDGYDGILNGGAGYGQRSRDELVACSQCGGKMHTLVGDYSYDFPDEEIETEWTAEERGQLPDLFSSVDFNLSCASCGHRECLGGFECA